jgi:hypothetical protein
LGDNIKEDEMDEACVTYWVEEKCMQALISETEGKRTLGR